MLLMLFLHVYLTLLTHC